MSSCASSDIVAHLFVRDFEVDSIGDLFMQRQKALTIEMQ